MSFIFLLAQGAESSAECFLDIPENFFAYSEESRRRQYTGAIGEMLSQDDYSRIKRDSDEVAAQMDRLKAIGNGQVPAVAALAWSILWERMLTK